MPRPPTAEDLLGEIYAAATEPNRWPQVTSAIARRHRAHVAALFTPYQGTHDRYLFADLGIAPEMARSYGEHWYAHDIWNIEGMAQKKLVARSVCISESVVPESDLVRTPFYNEWLARVDVRHNMFATIFGEEDRPFAPRTHLSLMRSRKIGPFSVAERDEVAALVAHLRRALTVYWQQRRAQEALAVRDAAFDAQGSALFWLSPRGDVEFANAAAQALWTGGLLLRSSGKRLIAFGVRASRPLADALAAACAGHAATVALAGNPGHVAYLLPPRAVEVGGRAVFGVLLQIDAAQGAADCSAVAALAGLHKLTATEAQVLSRLADGATPAEIAGALAVSLATVRTHLKMLFAKTGARRQADLVRLVHVHARRSAHP